MNRDMKRKKKLLDRGEMEMRDLEKSETNGEATETKVRAREKHR